MQFIAFQGKPEGDVEALCRDIVHNGWDIAAIFQQIIERVVSDPNLGDIDKSKIALELANRDYALLQGMAIHFLFILTNLQQFL
ncbi:hypothetical protein BEWA_041800 [Theileria equi strain WA]|uniref:Replication factor C C-terminal domain-containing protein n=1 Tax=Theileria equi strain WA TaxID=1537102 RepID=L1LFD0_THEEQ|nr:hypothetical protein BEWA_041800 [Theileria equi strain WA]EKX74142.1 hypothetical protein BEWA_041800 [Theileria equi strain WA]|eukprot:XP_004833594.1 hypothetical protein BEWA_041800 [Theileria equi strain WA]